MPKDISKVTLNKQQDHYRVSDVKTKIPHFETEAYLDYRKMWYESAKGDTLPDLPINLDLHITNKCNLLCPFCPRTWQDLSGGFDTYGFMSMELYKKIVDQGIGAGVKALHFTANGEPLLHKGLEEMVRYANEKGILEVIVHTNATPITEKRALSLLDAGIHRLAISFDSPRKETYEKLRVGAKFEDTLEKIKNFMRLRNEQGKKLPTVRVQMVDQEANKDEREEFDELFGEIADHVSHVYYIDYMGGANEFVSKDVIEGDGMSIGKQVLNENFRCSYLWQRLIIEWDGTCHPCFYGFDLKVGNINEKSLHEIWHGKEMTDLRKLHSTGNYNKCESCNKCGRQFETTEDDDQTDFG